MVELDFGKKDISFKIFPYKQCDNEPCVHLMDFDDKKVFESHIKTLNNIILNDAELKNCYSRFVQLQRRNYRYLFTPWDNKYTIALFNRGLLPFVSSKKKMLVLYDYLVCPAHRDNLIYLLKEHLFGNE